MGTPNTRVNYTMVIAHNLKNPRRKRSYSAHQAWLGFMQILAFWQLSGCPEQQFWVYWRLEWPWTSSKAVIRTSWSWRKPTGSSTKRSAAGGLSNGDWPKRSGSMTWLQIRRRCCNYAQRSSSMMFVDFIIAVNSMRWKFNGTSSN